MRVLVTGGGTGIGLAIAEALEAAGDEVVIAGRREHILLEAAAALGVRHVVGDITDAPEALLDAGPFDGLVNNAGVARHAPIAAWTAADWDLHHAVHVRGPALLSRAFSLRLIDAGLPGSIVNVSSNLGLRPAPTTAAYSASKAAMLSLTRSLAVELAPSGIRANAVLPGVVPTAMTATGDDPEARLEALRLRHPLGRLGAPADVASAVAWLLHAEWVTGAELAVDGGLLIG